MVRDRPTEYALFSLAQIVSDQYLDSPIAVLAANQRKACDVCTTDPEHPFMVDGGVWETHLRSKNHRYMRGELRKGTRQPAGARQETGHEVTQSEADISNV